MTMGIMEVTLLRARGLKNAELFGKVDPYVVLQYKSQEQKSSTGGRNKKAKASFSCIPHYCLCVRGQGVNPVWDEKFKFQVEYPSPSDENDQKHHKLLLKIMDRDTFTHDDYLGQATIYLKELFALGLENGKAEIGTQKYRIVSSDNTYHGEIQVGITFKVQGKLTDQQEHGRKEVKNDSI